ncbi:amidohydrolase [Yinghuangia soli]|uniref:Amidohydrolase n=1 Tax=Yinghuangia soli TaxID=2908204 RepID=A0AA41Q0T0_9ACTN|nr:amidohydrolase [Yinghuangia soli]MCF2529459.1 amidohydrolase [Yinghuangia soli]
MIEFRRDLHRHPELAFQEFRTTGRVADRLAAAGLAPRALGHTGLVCDIPGDAEGATALRADLDGLPVHDEKDVPYRSTFPGISHACGHDVHVAGVLGAGVVLARIAAERGLPRPVRLLFQPAEEAIAGARMMIDAGVLAPVRRVLGVHCDPKIQVGRIGLRTGPLTSACDLVKITVTGPGGHTSRPHESVDILSALAAIATAVPSVVARTVDPRVGLSIVWGRIEAGSSFNTIASHGAVEGTFRCTDEASWMRLPGLVHAAIEDLSSAYGVDTEVAYTRGVPPVVNEAASIDLLRRAAEHGLGAEAVVGTEQSLGGEDFAWFLREVPGAMARLGVGRPGRTGEFDLHQGHFDVDEQAVPAAVRVLAGAALLDV